MFNIVDQTRLPDTEPFAKKTTPPSVPTTTPTLGKTAGAAQTALLKQQQVFKSVETNTRVSSIEILLVKHELNQKEECDHISKPEDAFIAYTL